MEQKPQPLSKPNTTPKGNLPSPTGLQQMTAKKGQQMPPNPFAQRLQE